MAHLPNTSRAPEHPPTGHPGGHDHKPSPDPQNACGLGEQTRMPLPVPSQGYRPGQTFHSLLLQLEGTLTSGVHQQALEFLPRPAPATLLTQL